MNILEKVKILATGRNVLYAMILFILSMLFINALNHPVSILTIKELSGGHTILNVLPYYNAQIGYEHLEAYTPEAVNIYKHVLLYDVFILIPVYLAFLTLGIQYFGKKHFTNKKLVSIFLFFPIIAGLLNVIEDLIVVIMLNNLPNHLNTLMTICGTITTSKSVFMLFSLLFIVIGLIKSIKSTPKPEGV